MLSIAPRGQGYSGRVVYSAMRKLWTVFIFFILFGILPGCHKKPVAPPQAAAPPPPAPLRSQMPPASAEVIEHCVVSKQENANTVTCRCQPVTTRIDSKTGHTVIVCKKMPRMGGKAPADE
jgi:hypothetical protein